MDAQKLRSYVALLFVTGDLQRYMDKKMIQFIQIVIFLSLVTVPFSAISDDRTNENHFERMEFYLEQALWKFEDGNFIVYRTKKGFLDFVLFPEIPMNTFKTNVYKSNQNNEIGQYRSCYR